MKSRFGIRLALAVAVAATGVLAAFVYAAHRRAVGLRAEIASLRSNVAMTSAPEAPPSSSIQTGKAPADSLLAERAALLEVARAIPELALREAALRTIGEIKARHERTPPRALPLPPPVPKDAPYFVELLEDPEYLQLLRHRWRLTDGSTIEQRLEKAGIPEAVRARVLEIEFENHTAISDLQSFVREGGTDRAVALKAFETVRRENEAPLRELLGDAGYTAYRRAPVGSLSEMFDWRLEPLAVRSSYLGAPLDSATRQRLLALMQTSVSPGQARVAQPPSPEFVERARAILTPAQMVALDELAAEYQAAQQRRNLPKSSELPRTIRRQKAGPGN
jgi:hypothetical protein